MHSRSSNPRLAPESYTTDIMSRRQSRNKQPASYRVEEEYSFLDEEDDGSSRSRSRRPVIHDDEEDGDDFMPDANAEEEPDDDFDDVAEEEESQDETAVDEEALAQESSIIDVEVTPSHSSISKGKGKRPETILSQVPAPKAAPVQVPHSFAKSGGRKVNMDDDKLRSRGIADFSKQGGQEMRLKDLFGPALSDLKPILKTRDEWRLQETLPICGVGLRRSYFESIEARAKDEKFLQNWYAKTGRQVFGMSQKSSVLSQEQGLKYMLNDGANSINVLIGTTTNPQLHPLQKNSFVNVADPFEDKAGRKGWLFNLGSRTQDAQWMTNEDGSTQYLAVAVEQKDMTSQQPTQMEQPTAPAFSATKPFAASIQIWAFEATEEQALDISKNPLSRHKIETCHLTTLRPSMLAFSQAYGRMDE